MLFDDSTYFLASTVKTRCKNHIKGASAEAEGEMELVLISGVLVLLAA